MVSAYKEAVRGFQTSENSTDEEFHIIEYEANRMRAKNSKTTIICDTED